MPSPSEPLQNFNLDTMSGVHPGTRTQQYQRLRLRPHRRRPWRSNGRSCNGIVTRHRSLVLRRRAGRQVNAASSGKPHRRPMHRNWPRRWPRRWRIATNTPKPVSPVPISGHSPASSDDGLPVGRCGWGQGDEATATRTAQMCWRSSRRWPSAATNSCATLHRRYAAQTTTVEPCTYPGSQGRRIGPGPAPVLAAPLATIPRTLGQPTAARFVDRAVGRTQRRRRGHGAVLCLPRSARQPGRVGRRHTGRRQTDL